MNRVGIDPGVSGGIVVMANDDPVEWMRMPVLKVGKSSRVDCAEIVRMLDRFAPCAAYIEQVHAMPRQGAVSMFTFGHAAGVVTGAVVALGCPLTLVTPQTWKKRAGLIGTEKDAARSRAIMLWPKWGALSKKGEGQALADAALIARFGDG